MSKKMMIRIVGWNRNDVGSGEWIRDARVISVLSDLMEQKENEDISSILVGYGEQSADTGKVKYGMLLRAEYDSEREKKRCPHCQRVEGE